MKGAAENVFWTKQTKNAPPFSVRNKKINKKIEKSLQKNKQSVHNQFLVCYNVYISYKKG
jgi:hypothetical protein